MRTPPYHPASNGLREDLQRGDEEAIHFSLSTWLLRFLFKYRITPHSTTGVSPAKLMLGRKLRCHLDHMHPDLRGIVQQSMDRQKQAHDSRARVQDFAVGCTLRISDMARSGSQAEWWRCLVLWCILFCWNMDGFGRDMLNS